MKLDLKNITLVCADSVELARAIDGVEICKYYADFADVKLFTHFDHPYKHIVKIPKLDGLDKYSRFMLMDLDKYIETDYVLTCQWDGFILNPDAWTSDFLEYDFIGAPWMFFHPVIGNGGFSLRSKKFTNTISKLLYMMPNININQPEDYMIMAYLKERLMKKYDFKIPSIEIADKFSVEDREKWTGSFGFHSLKKVKPLKDGWQKPPIRYLTTEIEKWDKIPFVKDK